MAVSEMKLAVDVNQKSLLSNRLLGTLGMIGAPMLLVETL
jgi:hypothetical protein